MWAVGMIIFELFVGKDLVRCFRTNEDVVDALDCVSKELGARLYTLLKDLLFKVRMEVAREMLDDGIMDDPNRVSRALKDVAQKVGVSKYLQDMIQETRDNDCT